MAVPKMTAFQYSQASKYVSGMCFLASALQAQGLITAAQGNTILTSVNAVFGTAGFTLAEAGGGVVLLMAVNWSAGTLPTDLQTLAADCAAAFPDSNANNHPIGNWLAVIAALGASSTAGTS